MYLKKNVAKKKLTGKKGKRVPTRQVVVNYLYGHYKFDSKRRSRPVEFKLTKEQFDELIHGNCYYCGEPPSNLFTYYQKSTSPEHKPYLWNGIDRVDSSKGYVYENCVTCCKRCNRAKSDLSLEDFLAWIKKVYSYSLAEGGT